MLKTPSKAILVN